MKAGKGRILFIENDKFVQLAYERMAGKKDFPYDYAIAGSVKEAANILELEKFDAVVMDYLLGDGTALNLFDKIKETPIIIATGAGDEEIVIKAMKAGTFDYLIKDAENNYLLTLPITIANTIKRKRAESQLRKLSRAVEQSPVSIIITGPDGNIEYVNPQFTRITGYSFEEILGKNSRILKSGEQPPEFYQQLWETINAGGIWRGEFHNKKKNGELYWEAASISPIINEEGVIANFVGVNEDITERKKADKELAKYRQHLEELVKKRTFKLSKANEQLKREITERKQAEMALTDHRQYLEELVEKRTEELTASNEDLRREITERKRAEGKLKSSRKELQNLSAHLQSAIEEERTWIAREIHDELGQLLTALQNGLSYLTQKLPSQRIQLVEKTKTMYELTDTCIQTVQKISSDLRPSLLDKLGIIPALKRHAKEFQAQTGIKCLVSFNPGDIVLDKDYSTMIFRIFQESLTNIARHANAALAQINLKKENDILILTIKDNGRGITLNEVSSPKSFGIIGIRERVNFVGGKFEIKGVKGTTVTVTVPLSQT